MACYFFVTLCAVRPSVCLFLYLVSWFVCSFVYSFVLLFVPLFIHCWFIYLLVRFKCLVYKLPHQATSSLSSAQDAPGDYQLWVLSGKEEGAYPLIGGNSSLQLTMPSFNHDVI